MFGTGYGRGSTHLKKSHISMQKALDFIKQFRSFNLFFPL